MKRALFFISVLGWISCTNTSSSNQDLSDTSKKNAPSEIAASDSVKSKNTTSDSASGKAWLLVPGRSAGLTNINENADSIYQRLGKPDGGDAAMQKAVAIWYSNHDSINHSVAIYTSREPGVDPIARVQQIRITSPTFHTAEGIHTGSTLREIETAYSVQKGEMYIDEGIQYRLYDSKKGIAFEIAPDESCVAIVIHQSGVLNSGSTYLKFRTTNKFITQKKE